MKYRRCTFRKWPIALLGLILWLASCGPGGTPVIICDSATLTVTKTADTNDGLCDGLDCSLREAVIKSNACPGTQTIMVPAGTYNLSLAGVGEDLAATGDLDLTDSVIIMGDLQPVIDGGGRDRIFEIFPGVTASLSYLVVQHGQAQEGGGILNHGTLNVNESTIQNNAAVRPHGAAGTADGGGIKSEGGGSLGVYLSTISGNTAELGGGIMVYTGGAASPSVMISHTLLAENSASTSGGGFWLDQGVQATVIRFQVEHNSSGDHGNGLYNAGTLELTDGSITENNGGIYGGGIYNDTAGTIISREVLVQNNLTRYGGGIYNLGMAHFYYSALVENQAERGEGGGAYNTGAGAGLLLNNTTVSGNSAPLGGGGIRNVNGNLSLMFATIAANDSGGIRSTAGGDRTMRNTIVAVNVGGNCVDSPPDSIGHNIEDTNTCLLIEPSDLPNTDPQILPLALNGGSTPTHALNDGSPAIDSADPDRCDGTDQRLVIRPQGAGCDRGAYEKEEAGSASIHGLVFHDMCALPDGPLPLSAPPGCIDTGGYYEANGVLDPGEPGIPDVTVDLAAGSCASGSPLTTAVTAGDGTYSFTGLSAGTYCVSINALNDDNISALIPGGWTYPTRGGTVVQTEITLAEGGVSTGINFGWDYQFLPAWPGNTPTPTPSATPTQTSPPTPAKISFWKLWYSTDHFYYYGSDCGPNQVQFQIEVSDPSQAASVGIFFRLQDKASGKKTDWSEVFAMNPIGGGRYAFVLLVDQLPDYNSFSEAWLQFGFVANDAALNPLAYSDYYLNQITLSMCGKPDQKYTPGG